MVRSAAQEVSWSNRFSLFFDPPSPGLPESSLLAISWSGNVGCRYQQQLVEAVFTSLAQEGLGSRTPLVRSGDGTERTFLTTFTLAAAAFAYSVDVVVSLITSSATPAMTVTPIYKCSPALWNPHSARSQTQIGTVISAQASTSTNCIGVYRFDVDVVSDAERPTDTALLPAVYDGATRCMRSRPIPEHSDGGSRSSAGFRDLLELLHLKHPDIQLSFTPSVTACLSEMPQCVLYTYLGESGLSEARLDCALALAHALEKAVLTLAERKANVLNYSAAAFATPASQACPCTPEELERACAVKVQIGRLKYPGRPQRPTAFGTLVSWGLSESGLLGTGSGHASILALLAANPDARVGVNDLGSLIIGGMEKAGRAVLAADPAARQGANAGGTATIAGQEKAGRAVLAADPAARQGANAGGTATIAGVTKAGVGTTARLQFEVDHPGAVEAAKARIGRAAAPVKSRAARQALRVGMSAVDAQADRLAYLDLSNAGRRRDTADLAVARAAGFLRCDCSGGRGIFSSEQRLRQCQPCLVPHSLTEQALALIGKTECEAMGLKNKIHQLTIRSGNRPKGIPQALAQHGRFTLPLRAEPLAAVDEEEEDEEASGGAEPTWNSLL